MRLNQMFVFFKILMFSICVIATSSSQYSENQPAKKITDLNDDCLYDTFIHLDIDSLDNLADTNTRFSSLARPLFTKKVFESMQKIRNIRLYDYRNQFPLLKESSELIQQCSTNSKTSADLKLILLFKFSTLMSRIQSKDLFKFVDAIKPFVVQKMGNENELGAVASMLTFYEHVEIISYFGKFRDSQDIGWIFCAYMMVLEKSPHLINQFTYPMMKKLNEIRNAANAHYVLYKESSATEFEYTERFKLDWKLYKEHVISEDVKGKFLLEHARYEVKNLDRKFPTVLTLPMGTQYFARVYCAIQSLSGPNFKELVDSSNLNFGIFDLAIAEQNNSIIQHFRKSLDSKCGGCSALETGLQEQLALVNAFIDEKLSTTDEYIDFMKAIRVPNRSQVKFLKRVTTQLERLGESNNLSEYIELLKVCVQVSRYESNYESIRMRRKVFHAFFTFVDRPALFENLKQLNEVNRLHIQLWEEDLTQFVRYRELSTIKGPKELLNKTFENFESLFSPKENDTSEVRIKQRVILKIVLYLANQAFQPWPIFPEGGNEYEQRIQIMKLMYTLSSLDGEALATDRTLMHEWINFNRNINVMLKRYYMRGSNIDAFEASLQACKMTGNAVSDSIDYLILLNIAEVLHDNESLPDQLLDKILALEESIGDAVTVGEFLRLEVLAKKLKFYADFSGIQAKQEKNLREIVESKIELILSQLETDSTSYDELHILRSIYILIENNQETVKTQLGEELIGKLGHLSYGLEYKNPHFNSFLQLSYENCTEILRFPRNYLTL